MRAKVVTVMRWYVQDEVNTMRLTEWRRELIPQVQTVETPRENAVEWHYCCHGKLTTDSTVNRQNEWCICKVSNTVIWVNDTYQAEDGHHTPTTDVTSICTYTVITRARLLQHRLHINITYYRRFGWTVHEASSKLQLH